MSILYATKETFENQVLRSDKPVLVDFFATWCGPCKMIGPILEEIAEEREDIKVVKIDVDQEPELAAKYGVVSIPTLFVIENGEIKNQAMGAMPKAQLLNLL